MSYHNEFLEWLTAEQVAKALRDTHSDPPSPPQEESADESVDDQVSCIRRKIAMTRCGGLSKAVELNKLLSHVLDRLSVDRTFARSAPPHAVLMFCLH